MELPDYEPTPPGIPAEYIDSEDYHSLFDFEDADAQENSYGARQASD